MPINFDEQPLGFVSTLSQPQVEPVAAESALDVTAAAFRQVNSLSSLIAANKNKPSFVDVPDYDPFDDIAGYEDYADSFIDSRSPEETAFYKMQINNEKSDRETLQAAGLNSIPAYIAAGVSDPLLIPAMVFGMGEARGLSVGKAIIQSSAIGAATEVPAEAALNITQKTRTLEESAINIGGAALLSGILGGTINKMEFNKFNKTAKELDDLLSPPDIEKPITTSATAPRSMGSAQSAKLTPEQMKLVKVGGVSEETFAKLESYGLGWLKYFGVAGLEKIPVSPLIRMSTSRINAPKEYISQLLESPLVTKGNKEGVTSVPVRGSAETEIKAYQASLYDFKQSITSEFKAYRARIAEENKKAIEQGIEKQKVLSQQEFRQEIGRAARRDDKHKIPEIQKGVEKLRSSILDPMKNEAIALKLLPEDVAVTTSKSYLMRMYNHNKIIARRGEWDNILNGWLKSERTDNLARLQGYTAKGKEPPVSLREMAYVSDAEIAEAVDNITNKILGDRTGRMPYKVNATVRGPLKERVLNIQDRHIEDFLESDADIVAQHYIHTMGPDIALSRRFGDVELKAEQEAIQEEYKKLIEAAKSEKERNKLYDEMKSDIEDLTAIRDQLRGTYKLPDSPDGFAVRVGRSLRTINFLRLLGGMTVSAFTDIGRHVVVNGLAGSGKGLVALASSPKNFNLARNEARKAGVGLDMVLNNTALSRSELNDVYASGSKFERGLKYGADAFGKLSLMTQWNASMKQFMGVMVQDRILNAAKQFADGTISKADMARMAQSGISKEMAERISSQFNKYGDTDVISLSNGHLWDDEDALSVLKSAILKDTDRGIVTVGSGEKPLWTSSELGKMVFQFKSFAASAHHKVLISGLQYRDAKELNGFLMSVALGTLVYGVKQSISGQPISSDPEKIILEGFDRSGSTGYFMDVNNMTEKLSRGKYGLNPMIGQEPMSRYASRNWIGAAAGPSLGTAQDIGDIIGVMSEGEATEAEVHKMRMMLPAQNLFYMRWLFDQLENTVSGDTE